MKKVSLIALVAVLALLMATSLAWSKQSSRTPGIYTAGPDGSGLSLVAKARKFDNYQHPAWSPDGTKIAFASGFRSIFVVSINSKAKSRITPRLSTYTGYRNPAWSPDGTRVAFGSNRGLYIVNRDGSGKTRILKQYDVNAPIWSPDGEQFVFSDMHSVYLVNTNGAALIRKTDESGIEYDEDHEQSWSPDGSRIAFSSDDGVGIVNRDSSVVRSYITFGWAGIIRWSPNGTKIAFYSDEGKIFTINPDGSGKKRIARFADSGLSWSPDSTKITYGFHGRIYVANVEGVGGRTLVAEGSFEDPEWSPDGTRIAFSFISYDRSVERYLDCVKKAKSLKELLWCAP